MTDNAETVWELPDPLSVHEVQVDADTRVSLRRHGNPDGPRLVLSHGNGLAIDLFYPFWSLLSDDFDLIVYEHFGERPKVGVYHSVSSLVALLSPTMGSTYAGLVMFDPPLRKPNVTDEEFDAASMRTAAMARRRTARFRSREEFSDILPYVPAFQHMVPGAHELMAKTTLRESADGEGYELRCPPEYEAQIIDYARIFCLAVDFEVMQCPLKVIGADPTVPYSYLPTLDLSDVTAVHYDFLPDTTHFLPIEQPQESAGVLREFLGSIDIR